MPNWVSIVVNFEGEQKDINNIFNLIKGVDNDGDIIEFDFNKLIPRPAELNIVSGGKGTQGLAYLFKHAKIVLKKKLLLKRIAVSLCLVV